MDTPFNTEDLIAKLKVGDPEAEILMRNYKSFLLEKYMSRNWEIYADIGKVYEEAGLLEKAKNSYYNAYAYAEKSSEVKRAGELFEKAKTLPGNID